MKKLLLLLIGLIPLPLGYYMNHLIMTVYFDKALPYGLIGIIYLLVWFGLGYLTYYFTNSDKEAMIIVHFFGFIDIVLILFQVVVMKHYWSNIIGISTQFFFLPLLNIAGKLTFFGHRFYWVYIVAFALLCAAFYLGRLARKKQTNSIQF
ncbi:hypothetical protein IMX26_10105 [Clostridium sp. 'deep sea']|uniref:hypothetical protein n=1 Tax=Clostridium sp. 'deep sea' TaxID=2779445 RepID=UPI0018968ECD|nr:hypothetical protein [Clostridium sp. 'deep sea']QOR33851.1 hypothetical protein IMX26_10105 [Clostridium sp. 'deep sea']